MISLIIVFGLIFLVIFLVVYLLGGKPLRRKLFSLFRKKDIEKAYLFAKENEDSPLFKTFKNRIEQYIKKGFHNPLVIEIAEMKLNKHQKTREIGNFIVSAMQKGYTLREAKRLVVQEGYNKKLIQASLKLNKKEDKIYGVQEKRQVPRIERQTGSYEADAFTQVTRTADERGRSAVATDGRREPIREPRYDGDITTTIPKGADVERWAGGTGRAGRGIEPRRNGRIARTGNEPRARTVATTTTKSSTSPSNTARTSTNRQPSRQRNIQARTVKEPVEKSRYFG